MPKPSNFGTMGTVNTELSSDFTLPDIKKKKDADLPQIAGMCPGRPISKPVETDVIPVINKGVARIPSFKSGKPATPDNLTMKGSDAHPGFKSVQSKIADQYGGDMKKAGAILASRSRSASPAAKAKNPNLSKVKGEAKQKGFDDVESKSLKDKVVAGTGMVGAGYVGSEIANRTQDARRLTENKRLTKEFKMADRGNASYVEMKEFMNAEFVEKGGTSPETLPADRGDSAADDQLKDIMKKKQPPKGGLKTESPDLTMADDVAMVGDKAEDDITSGYVGDTQGAKVGGSKGFDAFNELVEKGIVADVNINRYNVHDSVAKVNEVADVTMKGVVSRVGAGLEGVGKRVEEGLRSGTSMGKVGRFDKRLRRGAADVVGGHKKLVGGALVGGAGLGAAAGGKKIYDKVVED